jgi:hypothetical protein
MLIVGASHAQVDQFQTVNFHRSDSIAALYPRHSLTNLKQLSGKLTAGLNTDIEKFRALYRWVCDNIAYDYNLYQKNQKKRSELTNKEELKQWNEHFSKIMFKTLREKQRTVCTGYAYLLRELCTHANINCVIVDGYGRTAQANIGGAGKANHSWNAVQLNGQWYLCDPTWSSGAFDTQERAYVRNFEPAYFLAAPALFIRNHYPLDSTWTILDHKPSLHEFLNRPLIYSGAYRAEVHDAIPDKFDVKVNKGDMVSFAFKGKKGIEKTSLLVNGVAAREKFQEADGQYSVNHYFKAKGKYVVHILVNGGHVLTYRVKVM